MTSENAISFRGLGHAYTPGQWVFRGYGAEIPEGSVVALLGPNGRGKSTLLHNLLGVLPPSEGRVTLAGRVAFVPQLLNTAFAYSVLDMVLMGRARRIGLLSQPSAKDEAAALVALERFGLANLATRAFDRLSGGQRQLVILARALAAEAEILVLDEPCASLDLKNQGLILEWIERLSRHEKLTILFTSHQPEHALSVATHVLLMLGTEEFTYGRVDEVLTEANLERLYGLPMRRLDYERDGVELRTFVPLFPLRRPTGSS